MGSLLPLSITRRIYFNYNLFQITYKNKVLCQKFVLQCQLTCLYTLFTSNLSHLPPKPPRNNTHYFATYCSLVNFYRAHTTPYLINIYINIFFFFFFFFFFFGIEYRLFILQHLNSL